jgi:hypothetical protein
LGYKELICGVLVGLENRESGFRSAVDKDFSFVNAENSSFFFFCLLDVVGNFGRTAGQHPKTDRRRACAIALAMGEKKNTRLSRAACCSMCLSWIYTLWDMITSKTIVMSRGMKVTVGAQIAEGGFSFVFSASSRKNKFALKKILCQTAEQVCD